MGVKEARGRGSRGSPGTDQRSTSCQGPLSDAHGMLWVKGPKCKVGGSHSLAVAHLHFLPWLPYRLSLTGSCSLPAVCTDSASLGSLSRFRCSPRIPLRSPPLLPRSPLLSPHSPPSSRCSPPSSPRSLHLSRHSTATIPSLPEPPPPLLRPVPARPASSPS